MPKICYKDRQFTPASARMIRQANEIIGQYQAQGFQLTLRQLYYQFVSRDLLPNRQNEYNRLGSVINDARLAGQIDWEAIIDRTRNLQSLAHWDNPQQILSAVAQQFRTERWETQPRRVEVWIEKDALVGVIEGVCNRWDIPFFSCRGYTSASELWAAAQRLGAYIQAGQAVTILHLGDHDPSGKDMTRDIFDRLDLFLTTDLGDVLGYGVDDMGDPWDDIADGFSVNYDNRPPFEVDRIALNWDQIQQYQPPPNPAKLTDSRAQAYIAEFGRESWELDALEPAVLSGLIEDQVDQIIDPQKWEQATDEMEQHRTHLVQVHRRWDEVVEVLSA